MRLNNVRYAETVGGSEGLRNVTSGANPGTYTLMDFDTGAGVDTIQAITKTGTAAATYVLNWDSPSKSTGWTKSYRRRPPWCCCDTPQPRSARTGTATTPTGRCHPRAHRARTGWPRCCVRSAWTES